jgi:aryl sulfotransferase
MDVSAFLQARERAAMIDGIELGPLHPPPPRPDGERDRFWQWVDLHHDDLKADLARYAARVRALASDDLVEWLHREPID